MQSYGLFVGRKNVLYVYIIVGYGRVGRVGSLILILTFGVGRVGSFFKIDCNKMLFPIVYISFSWHMIFVENKFCATQK